MSEKQSSDERENHKRKRKERTRKEGEGKSRGKSTRREGPGLTGDPLRNVESSPVDDSTKKKKKLKPQKDGEVNGDIEAEIAHQGAHLAEIGSATTENGRTPDFASYYLRKITQELADDLDKIRSANDFSEKSLPILIHALQQGQSIFPEEEKAIIMKRS